jgi:hypothetical protein
MLFNLNYGLFAKLRFIGYSVNIIIQTLVGIRVHNRVWRASF